MSLFRRTAHRDTIIDLTEPGSASGDSESNGLQWGLPLPCPKCAQPGYLDRIDPVAQIMYQHCPSCYCRWETDRAVLDSISSAS